jgi:hypothetical protein
MEDKTLSLCTTEDLAQELCARVPTIIIVMHIPEDNNSCDTYCLCQGNNAAVVGLADLALYRARKLLRKGFTEEEEQ